MKTVQQLLQIKGSTVWTIDANALQILAEKEIGALAVLESGDLAGIVSERDYARKVDLKGVTSRMTLVKEIMTRKVLYVRPDQTVEECMALMTEKRIRHIPVLKEGEMVGILSIGEVVKERLSEQGFLIRQLENYITGFRDLT
jgi:signal-transduction protein with cAMP-binding, CBS, and nucleotidyltransferase domain